MFFAEPFEQTTPPVIVAWAPNTPAATWSTLPVTFVLGGAKSRDVGDAAAAELDVALRTWSRVPCTRFRARFGGVVALAEGKDDGTNVVLFHDDVWPSALEPGALAQTVVSRDGSGNVRDTDIHVNGAEYRFSLDGRAGTIDLRSILVHEIGHALGLGHSSDPRATMHATGSGLRWRSLEKDDIEGVCALYPREGASPEPACDVVACPSGYFCVAGACQRKNEPRDVCAPCERVSGACEAAGDDARCLDVGAGRVCGRACANDSDCSAGFRCIPTTTAGDLQCVSNDGCRSAAHVCTTTSDCTEGTCIDGACKGPGEARDAGADAAVVPDAGLDAGRDGDLDGGGGCDCNVPSPSGARGSFGALLLFAIVLVRRHVTRRRLRGRSG